MLFGPSSTLMLPQMKPLMELIIQLIMSVVLMLESIWRERKPYSFWQRRMILIYSAYIYA